MMPRVPKITVSAAFIVIGILLIAGASISESANKIRVPDPKSDLHDFRPEEW
jgi:hypothetical protein